jgi:hypothetical protein
MRYNNKKYKFTHKTVGYFPSQSNRGHDRLWSSFYPHMFIEDIHHSIMPIGGRSRRKPDFSITVVPDEERTKDALEYLFGNAGFHERSGPITEIVSGFISDLAQQLSYFGRVHYEILRGELSQPQDTATSGGNQEELQRQAFRLGYVPGQVLRIGRYYLQLIPRSERPRVGKRYIVVPASDIWSIQLPNSLGSLRSHKQLLRSLAKASDPLPSFVMNSMKQLKEIRDFSFTDFHTQRELIAAYETASWGWPGRSTWDKSTLEYYQVYRDLQFALSMARMRNHILSSMNSLLSHLHITSQLQINGLLSDAEIQGLLEKLRRGEITVKDAFEAVQIQ